MALRLALWSQILVTKGGTLPSVQELVDRASCFLCLTTGEMAAIRLQLMCNLIGGNVIYYSSIPADPTNVFDPVLIT